MCIIIPLPTMTRGLCAHLRVEAAFLTVSGSARVRGGEGTGGGKWLPWEGGINWKSMNTQLLIATNGCTCTLNTCTLFLHSQY